VFSPPDPKRFWPAYGITTNYSRELSTFPSTLTHLYFGTYFDSQVSNLPRTITHISFGHKFNQPVDNLPPFLTHLSFGHSFNQPNTRFPHSLTYLSFGFAFTQPLTRLPPSVTHLMLGSSYSHRIPTSCSVSYGHFCCTKDTTFDPHGPLQAFMALPETDTPDLQTVYVKKSRNRRKVGGILEQIFEHFGCVTERPRNGELFYNFGKKSA
jgi:hypothetical protein